MFEVTVPGGFPEQGAWRRTLWLRPWTGRDELELFGERGEPAAAQATALLARCVALADGGPPGGAAFVRGLTAGDREALLLHLRRVTLGDAMPCLLDCPACGQLVQLDLSASALLLPPYGWEGRWHPLPTGAGDRLQFRLPTGEDQEAASRMAHDDPEAGVRCLAARCLRRADPEPAANEVLRSRAEPDGAVVETPGAALEPELLGRLADAMAELDPQAEVRIAYSCPECGHATAALLDSFTYIRTEAERSRRRLHRDVHLLALHYHWSEPVITALSPWQRRSYAEQLLDALEAQGAA
jgi:hypothetical protein